jgi:putative lipoprotein
MPRAHLLATLSTIAVMTATGTARGAAPQDGDPWFGRDKALHFVASASIASAGYAMAVPFTDRPSTRAAVGAGAAIAAGVGKELWDAAGAGDASWRDFTWDVVGTATGILIASAVDWIVRRSSVRRPDPSGHAP